MRIMFLLFLCLLPAAVNSLAQNDSIRLYCGASGYYGHILPHSESIRQLTHTRPYGGSISLVKVRSTQKDFEVFNHWWLSGVEVQSINFQNPAILGYATTLTTFAEPVLFQYTDFFLSIRLSTGLSYHSKVYDSLSNPQNLFFSSRISFPLYASLRFNYRMNKQMMFSAGAGFNHISNGGIKLPNKGMNFPMLFMGLQFSGNGMPALPLRQFYRQKAVDKHLYIRMHQQMTVRVMAANADHPQKTCFVAGAGFAVVKPLASKYAVNLGAEVHYDGYIRETLNRNGSGKSSCRSSLLAGQEFIFGRISFSPSFGIYVHAPAKPPRPLYQKYELRYAFSKACSAGFFLKAHRHVAESMGVIAGVNIFRRRL